MASLISLSVTAQLVLLLYKMYNLLLQLIMKISSCSKTTFVKSYWWWLVHSMRQKVPSCCREQVRKDSSYSVTTVSLMSLRQMRKAAVAPSDLCLQVCALYADTISLAGSVYFIISGSLHCIWCRLLMVMYIYISQHKATLFLLPWAYSQIPCGVSLS